MITAPKESERRATMAEYIFKVTSNDRDKDSRDVEVFYKDELIRCRDCKHYHYRRGEGEEWEWGHCDFFATGMDNNDFCSCAERRDTADDTVPTGFMSEWAREIDEQLGKLNIRKDSSGE